MRGRIGPTSQPGHVGPTAPLQMIGCASPKGADYLVAKASMAHRRPMSDGVSALGKDTQIGFA